MELTFDWVVFQELFGANRSQPSERPPIRVLVESGKILEIYSEGEDFGDWVGSTLGEMAKMVRGREIIAFEKREMEELIRGALGAAHFHQQIDLLNAGPKGAASKALVAGKHFLIEALEGKWSRFLPGSYGFYLRLEQEGELIRDFLIVVRRGQIVSFHRPDLSFLSPERRSHVQDVVKYLSDKYAVPVQSLVTSPGLWQRWRAADAPWRGVAQGLREKQVKLVPWRWSVASWVGARGILKI